MGEVRRRRKRKSWRKGKKFECVKVPVIVRVKVS